MCCVCSPESRQGSPKPRGDGPGLEALAQLASPASSRPQTVGGRSQTSALAQLADVESSSWGPKGGSQAHSKYGSFSADLDFDEFLERQQRFLQVCMCPVCLCVCARVCVCVCVCVSFKQHRAWVPETQHVQCSMPLCVAECCECCLPWCDITALMQPVAAGITCTCSHFCLSMHITQQLWFWDM